MHNDEDEEIPLVYNATNNKINEITKRIGFGRYHILFGLGISLKFFIDGSIITLITIISYALEEDWDLSTFELSFLSGSLLIGISLGYFSSPIFESAFSRIKTIYISLLLLMVTGTIASMMEDVWSLSTVLLFQGFFMSVSSPACLALVVEICPSRVRGSYILIILLFMALGQIFIISFSLILTSDLDSDYWRILQATTSALTIPALLILYQVSYESPLYLANCKEFNSATEVLNKIASINKTHGLSGEENDQVYSIFPFYSKTTIAKVSVLLNRWHLALTVKAILLSSMSTVAYYGVNAVLPAVLELDDEEDSEMLWGLFFIYVSQVPFILVFAYLVEVSVFGRKNSLLFSSTVICLLMIAIALLDDYHFTYAVMLFSIGLTFANACIADLYISEAFETELRVLILGLSNVCAVFLCSALILFFFYMDDNHENLLFVLLAFLFGILIIISHILPYDTTKMALDSRI